MNSGRGEDEQTVAKKPIPVDERAAPGVAKVLGMGDVLTKERGAAKAEEEPARDLDSQVPRNREQEEPGLLAEVPTDVHRSVKHSLPVVSLAIYPLFPLFIFFPLAVF